MGVDGERDSINGQPPTTIAMKASQLCSGMKLQVSIRFLNRNQELPLGDVNNCKGFLELVKTGL